MQHIFEDKLYYLCQQELHTGGQHADGKERRFESNMMKIARQLHNESLLIAVILCLMS